MLMKVKLSRDTNSEDIIYTRLCIFYQYYLFFDSIVNLVSIVGAEIAQQYNVQSMPTFVFIMNGKVVDRFSGASVEKLRQVIFSKI
jgi:hypothetical protein